MPRRPGLRRWNDGAAISRVLANERNVHRRVRIGIGDKLVDIRLTVAVAVRFVSAKRRQSGRQRAAAFGHAVRQHRNPER